MFLRRIAFLLIACGCLAGAAAAAATLQMDVRTAWDGWSRPGRVTEIELRLLSQVRGTAELSITAGGQVVRSSVNFEPGEPTRLYVPVPVTERVVVQSLGADGQREQREIRLALSEAPLLAWVAPASVATPNAGFHAVGFDAGALPRNAAAYSSIDALVIDRAVIDALAEEQLVALLSFIAGCGRTVLISAEPAAADLLQGAIGCGGRNFATVVSADQAPARVDHMLDSVQSELPDGVALAAIDDERGLDAWYLVFAVLAVCAAATALAAIFLTSLAAAVVVPAFVAAGGLWYVQSRPADARLLVWAETAGNDRLARYRGLQRMTVARRGAVEFPVLAQLGAPHLCGGEDRATWSWDAKARHFSTVRVAGRLLATASLCYSGAFPVTRAGVAGMDVAGQIGLRNTGMSAWPAGTLLWNGHRQSLPGLAAGGELLLQAGHGAQPATAAERYAVARTPLEGQAILWPLDLQSVVHAPTRSRAWLLLQVESTT